MGLCCCHCCDSTDEEREPIVGNNADAESARYIPQRRRVSERTGPRTGPITMRLVGVQDLDQRFKDVADTFNEQHKHYECMKDKQNTLMFRYRCSAEDNLSTCFKKIKDEHDTHYVRMQMRGYDFSLVVTPDEDVPDKLKRTQENVKELCQAVKAIVAAGTTLPNMISWLQKNNSLTQQVTDAAPTHQENVRHRDNLQENLQEINRAKELFPQYKKEAGDLLNEAAQLAGITP